MATRGKRVRQVQIVLAPALSPEGNSLHRSRNSASLANEIDDDGGGAWAPPSTKWFSFPPSSASSEERREEEVIVSLLAQPTSVVFVISCLIATGCARAFDPRKANNMNIVLAYVFSASIHVHRNVSNNNTITREERRTHAARDCESVYFGLNSYEYERWRWPTFPRIVIARSISHIGINPLRPNLYPCEATPLHNRYSTAPQFQEMCESLRNNSHDLHTWVWIVLLSAAAAVMEVYGLVPDHLFWTADDQWQRR